MSTCKAALYNPANACTGVCKWPGVCTVGNAAPPPAPAPDQALEVEAAPEHVGEVVSKKKPGRPKKAD